jgi:predicted permease
MPFIPDPLRQILRRLGRAPLFTALTLLTLAIGIGANTVVFSVVESVLLKPLPYPAADRLIGVWYTAPGINMKDLNIAPSHYFIDREQSTTLEDIGMYSGDGFNVTGSGQPEHLTGLDVTDGTLPLLGAKPALGRLFSRQDDLPTATKTAVISWAYWQRHFGGASTAIGSTLTMDGEAHQVIGVLDRSFRFLDYDKADIIVPFQFDRAKTKLGNYSQMGIARMKPGVTLQQANADLARLIPITFRSFPAPEGFGMKVFEQARIAPNARPLKQDVVGDIGSVLWVLMGSIALVLLVACANVANLVLVRVEGRRQELAVRSALGAGWGRIAADMIAESLMLAVAGSVIGLALAYAALRALVAAAPQGLPRLHEIGIDGYALAFTTGITLLTSLLIVLVPIFKHAAARSAVDLRGGGRTLSQSRERHRARKSLVVVQVALALVLLICSGLMVRTFFSLTRIDPGFNAKDGLQSFHFYVSETQIPEKQADRLIHQYQEIQQRLAALPSVTSVSFSSSIPLAGYSSNDILYTQDQVLHDGQVPAVRRFKNISPGYLATLGTRLVAGRDFTWEDTYQKLPVGIVSENFARENWGSAQAALGKKLRSASTDDWRQIVGVVQDVREDGISLPTPATIYWPVLMANFEGQKQQVSRGVTFALRSNRAGSQEFMREIERTVWAVNGTVPLSTPQTLGEMFTKSMARTTFTLVLLSVAGAMALLLGIIGIYGVISYTVSQRTREIGIRMALGAERGTLTALFVRQGLALAVLGAVIGVGASIAAMRFMRSLLFNVSPMDPATYVVATVSIVAIAWLACYIPSRRAAAVNPVNALRAE